MEIRYIRLFCLIEEHGSISKAAEAAGVSQPTVSQHLKTLETLLGVRLFDRSGRKVELTSSGRVFLPYARRMLSLSDEAQRALEEHGGTVRGELHAAGSTIPSTYLLPEYFGRFRTEYPDVVPHLTVTDSGRVCELVFNRSVELGFVGGRFGQAGARIHTLCDGRAFGSGPSGSSVLRKEAFAVERAFVRTHDQPGARVGDPGHLGGASFRQRGISGGSVHCGGIGEHRGGSAWDPGGARSRSALFHRSGKGYRERRSRTPASGFASVEKNVLHGPAYGEGIVAVCGRIFLFCGILG